jgi:hypothetical protein
MADIIRVSGTRQVTPIGDTTIRTPGGINYIESTLTNVTGNLLVDEIAVVTEKLIVSSTLTSTSTIVLKINQTDNVDNPTGFEYDPNDIYGTSNQRKLGALYVPGGVGIEKDLNVGGWIYGRVSEATTSQQLIVGDTNIDDTFYIPFVDALSTLTGSLFFGDQTGPIDSPPSPTAGLTYNPFTGKLNIGQIRINDLTKSSTSTMSDNALYVRGGVGIEKDLTTKQNLLVEQTATVNQDVFVGESVYTNFVKSVLDNIHIQPEGGLTEITGDIRVLGQKPIGTAPVVTNTLYVTVDGNDTNDGRAMDPSRACRTIGGALSSPYYQPGTQILVSAGRYLEDNPLRLKPYTSIRGSDIRTTFIEPINKTQDLFHLDSGCYLNYMTFLNGRSGLLEGPYAPGFNRGAYATAFPPLTGNDRIDLYHSPYVQNCTNQSGPWLKDGTLYQPNQTVQVPAAVGTGTWQANTTSIIVNVSTGTIARGMSINAGQQNPGFFNARTLMLASKPFMQEQVIAYINQEITANALTTSSIWYNFTYNQEKCRRDVGILIENVAYDASFGGNQKAVESGLAYYNGVISLIAGQEQQTTAAINYLNSLVQDVIINVPCADLLSGSGDYSQTLNPSLQGGSIASASINSLFGIITDIINDGPSVAPDLYTSTGPDAAFVSAEILMQANRAFIQQDTINFINNTIYADGLPYSEMKCRRDTGLIIDSIVLDMLYPTTNYSQSTFAGLQYWKQNNLTPTVVDELTTTTQAITYLKELSAKIIRNITPADDLIPRYQTAVPQVTATYQAASFAEVSIIESRFDEILEILNGNIAGWTDRIKSNGDVSNLIAVSNAANNLLVNTNYLANEVTAYIDTITATSGFTYSTSTCQRDIGYIINAVAFDLLHGGNRQSVQNGLYYYNFSATTSTLHGNQESATIQAFNHLSTLISNVIQNIPVVTAQQKVEQTFTGSTATAGEATILDSSIDIITGIISGGPGSALTPEIITFTATTNLNAFTAADNIESNKSFLVEEVIAYIDQTFNPGKFNYDETKCYRDVGLIVDAVSQDILLGGNQKSIEAGLAYWSAGYNYVAGQVSTTTMAINHARDIALQVIANTPVTPQTGTILTQVINTFFQYGGDYMPQQAVSRNFGIITNIIENGPLYAPPVYAGGGLFPLTGLNGADVITAPTVTAVYGLSPGVYKLGLSTSTVGFGNNSTLYIGNTTVFPYSDKEVEELSYEYTGNSSTWHIRKADPIGAMGGSLVDGAVISSRSPIQSFVYDAFTQVTQGGRGVHITNDGYAQLVSVFTIFCSVGVQTDNGGIASIVNSNANFGDICLLSKGFGKRKFTGHLYNPVFKAYPESPDPTLATSVPDSEYLDQYYPNGYWPNQARVRVFLPDLDQRPHISLIMEVVPPEGHTNEQQLPFFLNAAPTKAILSTGSIVINDIDTDGIAIGNYLYIRDQEDNRDYVATGTIVTDMGYRSVTLNKPLLKGGQDPNNNEFIQNDNWFDLYFCGNAYYSVLSSEISENPQYNRVGQVIPPGVNILSTASTGWPVDQVLPHADTLEYLRVLTNKVIINDTITPSVLNTTTIQTVIPSLTSGGLTQEFIDQRFDEIISILTASTLAEAENIIPERLRTKSGTIPLGASDSINLITENIEFLADEVKAYVEDTYYGGLFVSLDADTKALIQKKCERDTKIILQRLIYDIESGGRYNSVMAGLSYWNRAGAYHIVQLGENIRRPDLFPDGATVNFYQRSYMSASGYVFEYVGAGTNYSALPQVGRKDPIQGRETVQLSGGKVFFTSTDQNGDFRIGPGLVISQATGVLSGRTFTKSLFANLTPFMLAIEGGGS